MKPPRLYTGTSYMFPVLMMCFVSAFLMTSILVRSTQSRLRPTEYTTDDIRRISIHYHLIQLYHEFNDLMNKVSLCDRITSADVKDLRGKVIKGLAGDMDDLRFKMQDVFRVMDTQFELKYSSFDSYMGKIEYEEELAREISSLIQEAEGMIGMQSLKFEAMQPQLNATQEKVSNQTQLLRDEIRKLHIEYDLLYFGNLKNYSIINGNKSKTSFPTGIQEVDEKLSYTETMIQTYSKLLQDSE